MKVSLIKMILKSILKTLTIKYGGDLEIDWYWLILKCSRDWVGLVTKDSSNLIGDNSLEGLEIDWHLAEYDYSVELPIGDSQPSYAYAA